MWPREHVEQAVALHAAGLNYCEISRRLGPSRVTIRDWVRAGGRAPDARACFRCSGRVHEVTADYVYLLGLYLGDGYINATMNGVWRLRIVQDVRYPGLISECRLAMAVVTPTRVAVVPHTGCVAISAHWNHWPHVFPQHGPGPKWLRRITMEPWQQALINEYPGQLIRGLIHSDGSRFMNPIRRRWLDHPERRYTYHRYQFTNASDDIRLLFTDTCDLLGVRWTQTTARVIAISRKPDVEFLDRFIGPKC